MFACVLYVYDAIASEDGKAVYVQKFDLYLFSSVPSDMWMVCMVVGRQQHVVFEPIFTAAFAATECNKNNKFFKSKKCTANNNEYELLHR